MASKKVSKLEIVNGGSSPDVDTDFHTQYREKVLEHVSEIYGKDNVSNIITFGTLAAKGAIKAMCTIYDIPFAQANKISNLVPPPIEGVDCSLDDIYDKNSDRYEEAEEFRNATSSPEWQKIIEGARNIEGRNKSIGMHACGVIISSIPLPDVVPLQVNQKEQRVVSQWTYPELESLGLIKMDFLGLDTVDLIQHTTEYIMKNGKNPPNMTKIIQGDMDDPKVYEMLQKGNTIGIFQLGSDMVQNLLKLMKPDQFSDIVATTALGRPGPMRMQSHIKYADRKNGREEITPIHQDFVGSPLDIILKNTYNLIVYQEQIQQITNQIAGWSLQEGDKIRKAMGKKDKAVMDSLEEKFINGGLKNGYSKEAMNTLWESIMLFAKYGFNKCLYGRTQVALPDGQGKMSIEDLYKKFQQGESIKILSMFEDGNIKPHTVKNIVQTGVKPLYTVKTKSNKTIRMTSEHRLLTVDGYGTIDDGKIRVGAQLINDELWNRRLSSETLSKRKSHIVALNKSSEHKEKARQRMISYQESLTFEDRSHHQKNIQKIHPDRNTAGLQAMSERLKYLRNNDIEWQLKVLSSHNDSLSSRKGYGIPTVLSDGRMADSITEAMAAEYLISRGIDFELHKVFSSYEGKAKIADFYVDGLYFEMDGLRRGREYFVQEKYGQDIPFVYLTPADFKDTIDEALMAHHISNGDEIIEIIEPKVLESGTLLREMTYDIEMDDNGPSNFIANGIVSHNSHSVAYAMNAYQSAYLKTNYPVEFMAALISQNVDNKEKTLKYLREARRMGISVGTVDINSSDVRVAPDYKNKSDYNILFGISGVKAISETMAEIIVKERQDNGVYKSVQDVINRCSPLGVANKRIYENLAYAGAFDVFEVSRQKVIDEIPNMMGDAKTKAHKGDSLFDVFDQEVEQVDLTGDEMPFVDKLKHEADVIGLYLTGHPLSNIGTGASAITQHSLAKILSSSRPITTTILASVVDIETKGKTTRISIDDGTDYMLANLGKDVVYGIRKKNAQKAIQKQYVSGSDFISDDNVKTALMKDFKAIDDIEKNSVYIMHITFRPAFNESSQYGARVNWIRPLNLADNGTLPVRIRFKITPDNKDKMEKLMNILPKNLDKKMPGDTPIFVAPYIESEVFYKNNDIIFKKAIEEIKEGKTQNRDWEKFIQSIDIIDENKNITVKEKIDILEELPYNFSGYTTEKTLQVKQAIEKYVGYEAYDFGIIDPNIFHL